MSKVMYTPEAESLQRELVGRLDAINTIASGAKYALAALKTVTDFVDNETKTETEWHKPVARHIGLLSVELKKAMQGFVTLLRLVEAEHTAAEVKEKLEKERAELLASQPTDTAQ